MAAQISDVDLLRMLKEGDRQALALIFQQHSPRLYSLINRIINNPDQSKDLVQDIFYKLWIGREQLNIRSIKPYLARMAVNEALTYVRANPADRIVPVEVVRISVQEKNELEYKELEAQINKTIGYMPSQRRAVFILSRFEAMSYSEIAQQLNISEKTVEKHISLALESLRIALKPYFQILLLLFL